MTSARRPAREALGAVVTTVMVDVAAERMEGRCVVSPIISRRVFHALCARGQFSYICNVEQDGSVP